MDEILELDIREHLLSAIEQCVNLGMNDRVAVSNREKGRRRRNKDGVVLALKTYNRRFICRREQVAVLIAAYDVGWFNGGIVVCSPYAEVSEPAW